jgi:site-specific DNA recombinase
MTRAVAYLRVSTAEQKLKGISLEVQQEVIGRYCAERGWDLVETFTDSLSGARWERPALQRMLAQLPAGKRRRGRQTETPFDALVVFKLDRIARSASDTYQILRVLEGAGGVFVSATEPQFDMTTLWGRGMLGVAAIFAEMERAQISARMTAVGNHRAAQGRWSGRAPFGYRLENKQLVPDPLAAPHVRESFRLLVDEHCSLRRVAAYLARSLGWGPTAGKLWTGTDTRRLLTRAAYVGQVSHNGQVYAGRHEAIVEREVWDRAQELVALRLTVGRQSPQPHLLSGLLRCRFCGGTMAGSNRRMAGAGGRTRFHPQYRCTKANWQHSCRGQYISERKTHRALFALLRELSRSAGAIERLPRRDESALTADSSARELAEIERRRERLADYLVRGVLAEADYRRQRELLDQQEAAARIALREQVVPEQKRPPRQRFRDLAALLESGEVSVDEKRDLLGALISSIVIDEAGLPHLTLRTGS